MDHSVAHRNFAEKIYGNSLLVCMHADDLGRFTVPFCPLAIGRADSQDSASSGLSLGQPLVGVVKPLEGLRSPGVGILIRVHLSALDFNHNDCYLLLQILYGYKL